MCDSGSKGHLEEDRVVVSHGRAAVPDAQAADSGAARAAGLE